MADVLVIAFGGNAILPSGQRGTLEEQRENVRRMSNALGALLRQRYRVVVTHGNGPQVGEIMLRSEMTRDTVPPLTLDVAGAMSQGQIGYMLQQEIGNYLAEWGESANVCSVVTQVVVDEEDPAFRTPTKPIGRFYSRDDADKLRVERGWDMVEDAGRGYRRVVASPAPRDIVEWPAIRSLISSGALVVAAGGGGVPVVRKDGKLMGVEAVIDKDLSAQCLGSLIGATDLILLTEVEQVAVDFGTQAQRPLGAVSVDEMKAYLADGQFPDGSMGPKVRAAIRFIEGGGRRTIITSANRMVDAVTRGDVGTHVYARVPEQAERGGALRS